MRAVHRSAARPHEIIEACPLGHELDVELDVDLVADREAPGREGSSRRSPSHPVHSPWPSGPFDADAPAAPQERRAPTGEVIPAFDVDPQASSFVGPEPERRDHAAAGVPARGVAHDASGERDDVHDRGSVGA
jgi:hypothetical protein